MAFIAGAGAAATRSARAAAGDSAPGTTATTATGVRALGGQRCGRAVNSDT